MRVAQGRVEVGHVEQVPRAGGVDREGGRADRDVHRGHLEGTARGSLGHQQVPLAAGAPGQLRLPRRAQGHVDEPGQRLGLLARPYLERPRGGHPAAGVGGRGAGLSPRPRAPARVGDAGLEDQLVGPHGADVVAIEPEPEGAVVGVRDRLDHQEAVGRDDILSALDHLRVLPRLPPVQVVGVLDPGQDGVEPLVRVEAPRVVGAVGRLAVPEAQQLIGRRRVSDQLLALADQLLARLPEVRDPGARDHRERQGRRRSQPCPSPPPPRHAPSVSAARATIRSPMPRRIQGRHERA